MSFGKLDHSELRCCGQQMVVTPHAEPAYVCRKCLWGVTRVEFLRSAYLPDVAEAVATRQLGRQF